MSEGKINIMSEGTKVKMFEKVLELEHLSEAKTYDNRDYFEQLNGAWAMVEILGLGREYIRWSCGK